MSRTPQSREFPHGDHKSRDPAPPIDLLTDNPPEYYDIALRDFGLMLGALTLARLASVYDAPLRLRRR